MCLPQTCMVGCRGRSGGTRLPLTMDVDHFPLIEVSFSVAVEWLWVGTTQGNFLYGLLQVPFPWKGRHMLCLVRADLLGPMRQTRRIVSCYMQADEGVKMGSSYEYSDFLDDSSPKLFWNMKLFCPALEGGSLGATHSVRDLFAWSKWTVGKVSTKMLLWCSVLWQTAKEPT